MKRLCLLPILFSLFLTAQVSLAEEQGPNPVYKRGETVLEQTLPPSPESASKVKYADVPFTHSQGLAEYVIPFSPLEGCELTVPVGLRYRSGGIKLDETAGVAGLGWTLEAGGCVTRVVMDMPDEFVSSFGRMMHQMPTASDTASLSYLRDLVWHRKEAQLDRYSYSVCGLTGTFVLLDSGEVALLSGDGVSVSVQRGSDGAPLKFTLVGPDGTVYELSEREYTKHDGTNKDIPSVFDGEQDLWQAVTSWHLTLIRSRSGLEKATFQYEAVDSTSKTIQSRTWTITSVKSLAGDPPSIRPNTRIIKQVHYPKVLKRISLGDKYISVSYAGGTGKDNHGRNTSNFPVRLTGIALHHNAAGQLDSLQVTTRRDIYDGRIVLGSIRRYRNRELDDKWDFRYDTLNEPVSAASEDWYGYYNAGYSSVPFLASVNESMGVIRNGFPDASKATYMSLLEVDHDGVVTKYEYAGNNINDGGRTNSVGVHVKSIEVSTAEGPVQYRNFEYSGAVADGPVVPSVDMYVSLSPPVVSALTTPGFTSVETWSFVLHSTPVTIGSSIRDTRVFWNKVSEERSDKTWLLINRRNRAKTVYHFSNEGVFGAVHETIDAFPEFVADFYNHHYPTNVGLSPWDGIRSEYVDKTFARSPLLTRREEYSYDGADFHLVSSSDYTYQPRYFAEDITIQYIATQVNGHEEMGRVDRRDIYHYPVKATPAPDCQPVSVLNVSYHESGNDSTIVYKSYLPRSSLSQPIRLASLSSVEGGIERRLEYTYPDTWEAATPVWAATLAQQHFLSTPVKTEYKIGEPGAQNGLTPVRTELIEYAPFRIVRPGLVRNILYPKNHIEYYCGNECWRETVNSRDSYGNVTSVKERGQALTQIEWGSGGMNPETIRQDTLISRYTYVEGTGLLASATSPSSVVTKYDYDHAGRLTAIKDEQNRVLEEWQYHLFNNGGDGHLSRTHRKYRSADGSKFGEDITWWNTLGVHLQDIVAGGSGDGRNLVTVYETDALLNDDAKVWLPYPIDSDSLSFRENAVQEAIAFHGDSLAYQSKTYEMSPRALVESEALPGYAGLHETRYSQDICSQGFPHYVWVDGQGIAQKADYSPSEIIANTVKDADGRKRISYGDHAGRTLATKVGNNAPTYYIYDGIDQLRAVVGGGIALTDTLSMWRYSYDSLGRTVSKGIPGSVRECYTYDSEDRIIAARRGSYLKEMEYDALGRLSRVFYTEGSQPRRLLEEHGYTYDKETSARYAVLSSSPSDSSAVSHTYRYDTRGRRDKTVTVYPDGSTLTEELTYDFASDVVQTVTTAKVGGQTRVLSVNVSRDELGRTRSGTSSLKRGLLALATASSNYNYDALGRANGKTSSTLNGTSLTSVDTFTLQGWLSSREVTKNDTLYFRENYSYSAHTSPDKFRVPSYTGLITSKSTVWGKRIALPDLYAYDNSGRLIEEKTPNSRRCFTYDDRGNITSESLTASQTTVVTTSSYAGDRLLTRGNASFVHDDYGRMVYDGLSGMDLSYNILDLPKIVGESGGALVHFKYGANGVKLGESFPDGRGLEYRGPFVYRRSSTGDLTLESVSCPEGRLCSSGPLFYVTDYWGSVRAVINARGGTVYESSNYSAYGNRTVRSSSTLPSNLTLRDHYTGCEDLFPDFTLPYADHTARLYSASQRRWMVPDPQSEKYYGVSPYAYCAGNPLGATDRNGEWFETLWDIANVASDLTSLVDNIASGNILGAVVDGVATTVDIAAAIIPFVPGGAGTIVKGVRAEKALMTASVISKGADIVSDAKGLASLKVASEFGVDSYSNLRKSVINTYGKGSNLEVHHLIEKRFVKNTGINPNSMKSIVVTKEEHRLFTNEWRKLIPYNTKKVSESEIKAAAKQVYKDYPDILKALGLD